jgi:hypothetical protein
LVIILRVPLRPVIHLSLNKKKLLSPIRLKHNLWVFRQVKADVITNTLATSYNLDISDALQLTLVHMWDGVSVYTHSIEDVGT